MTTGWNDPLTVAHLQFCAGGQDITGSPCAGQDATEVRAWLPDGTLLGAVGLSVDGGSWHASASDVARWSDFAHIGYEHWQAALAALLALSNSHRLVPESEWNRS